ncbi:MAG: GIY-YIG nuclease family protein [Beijerinckiaceae bacterium]
MAKHFTDEDDALLEELGVEVESKSESSRTAREERIIAGFEEIQRFVEEHGRTPEHGEGRDIFERIYAVRLDRIRAQTDCRALVASIDHQNLLLSAASQAVADPEEDMDDDALLAELGVQAEAPEITELRHVRSSAEKREAEEIATREKCEDFQKFEPLFEKVQHELKSKVRTPLPFRKDAGFLKADIVAGNYFILGGQIGYVAEVGETFKAPNGEFDARLRVIYSNGTESNLLRRSLQRALYKDDTSRWISEPSAGPLFGDQPEEDDQASGTIYVLRSKSDHPTVVANRDLVHKIGVTNGSIKQRIAGAKQQATYLLADVEVVAHYELFNINRTKLENLLHRVFEPAKLEIQIKDRFGKPVIPREWFLVPLFVIDDVVQKIKDGTITNFRYDPESASLKEVR